MTESFIALQKLIYRNPFPTNEVEAILKSISRDQYTQIGSDLNSRCFAATRNSDSMDLLFWSRTMYLFGKLDVANYYVQALGFYYAAYYHYIQHDFRRAIEHSRNAIDVILKAGQSDKNSSVTAEIHIMAAYSYAECEDLILCEKHLRAAENIFSSFGKQERLTAIAEYRKSLSDKQPAVSSVADATQKLVELTTEIEAQTNRLETLQAESTRQKQVLDDLHSKMLSEKTLLAQEIEEAVSQRKHLANELQLIERKNKEQLQSLERDLILQQSEIKNRILQLDHDLPEHVKMHEAKLQQLTQEYEAYAQQVTQKKAMLDQEFHQFTDTITAEINRLELEKSRAHAYLTVWKLSRTVPLWLYIVRKEIEAGRVHQTTHTHLTRLLELAPDEASPLLIEIAARSGSLPNHPFELNNFSGETRLLAATVNARLLQKSDPSAALELLAIEWEIFLEKDT